MFMAERAGLPVVQSLRGPGSTSAKAPGASSPKDAYVAKYELVVPGSLVQE
jgi:hypothetical protein